MGTQLDFKPVAGVAALSQVDNRTRGMKFSEMVYVLGKTVNETSSSFAHRVFYYDKKGRVIQKVELHPTGTIGRYTTEYSFDGKVVTTVEEHAHGTSTFTKRTDYVYDPRGRLWNETVTLNGKATARAEYTYDELGRLIMKTYGTPNTTDAVEERYTYNIQGWLTSQSSDYFNQNLYYYDTNLGNASYTGNVSEARIQHANGSSTLSNRFVYTYDKLGRLTEGKTCTSPIVAGEKLQYDYNGNVTYVEKTSKTGKTLTWFYNVGNILSYIREQLPGQTVMSQPITFHYDDNGNMISHGKKQMLFTYNYLNLLSSVTDSANRVSEYKWLADGTLAYTVYQGEREFEFRGSLEYLTFGLETSFSSGKLILKDGVTPVTLYQIKDQLGSVRAVFTDKGAVYAQNDYYPFGERITDKALTNTEPYLYNRHQFNGKDYQITGGTFFLNFGMRMYDTGLYRWMNIDPLSESNPMFTGYAYTRNNPVNRIDLMGMADMAVSAGSTDWVYSEGGGYEWMDNVTSAETTPEGYRYVGSKDEDIVKDMGYKNIYPEQKQTRWGSWLEGDAQGWGIMRNKFEANAYFTVEPLVSYKKENRTENNRMGRTFEGLEFTGNYGFKNSTQRGEEVDIPFVMNVTSEQEEFIIRQRILDKSVAGIAGFTYYHISHTVEQQKLRMNRITNLQLTARPNIINPINNGIMIPSNVVSPYVLLPMRPFNFIQPL